MTQAWMSPIRIKYNKIIENLTKNADIFSKMYLETGDEGAKWAYEKYTKEICDLKQKIKDSEEKDKNR